MNIDELRERFGTDDTNRVKVNIVNAKLIDEKGDEAEIYRNGQLMVAPLGDLIQAYIEHLSISKWRRGWDWGLVADEMRNALNGASIEWVR